MRRRRLLAVVAGLGFVTAGGVAFWPGGGAEPPTAQAAPAVRTAPAGADDPLTPEEVTRAREIAGAGARERLASGRVELLYVERDDDKAAEGRRRAAAYFYDYRTDRLIVRMVDLADGRVVEETAARGVQPPPSGREEFRAAAILLNDERLGRGVREAYAKAAGRPPASAADLSTRGLSYTAERGPCRTHRCLRLFVRLPDGTFLDTSRIVIDLSAKKVHTLKW
jgi:hypothetical protein